MARHLFGLLGKAAALGLAALAAGCSTFVTQTTQPTENVTAIYSWHAKGNMVFTCAYDAEGAYWRFLKPEGALYDESGRKQADLLADFGIRARDGSRITARIVKQTDTDDARNLKPALFETSGASKGILKGIRYVERRSPKGGMPLAGCSASQRGKRLAVAFTARYIFYR